MTAIDIIAQVRERLGDEKKQRWTDSRLLTIISQGQVDICVESGYLRREILFPLVIGKTRFTLPSDCVTVKRVETQGKLLPLHSRSDLDIPRLEADSDYIAYKSNLQMNKLEVQPAIEKLKEPILFVLGDRIDDTLFVDPIYGVVVSSTDPELIIDPAYGVITGVDADFTLNAPSDGFGEIAGSSRDISELGFPNGEYGVVTTAEYITVDTKYGVVTEVKDHIVSGRFGIVTNVAAFSDSLHVYYVAAPAKVKYLNTVLILPEIWEDLLMRYVVGTALQDDNDANNIARGEAELQKYLLRLETIKDLSSKDFSGGASDKYTTEFRRT